MSRVAATRSRAAAVPPWVWLTVIVLGSIAARIALAHRILTPWIMVDELIYSELAKSLAAHGQFLVRGVTSTGYGFVYPALLAPSFRLFGSVPDAYTAAKVTNAVVMSLAAVPVYFLARRLLAPGLALCVVVLALIIPSMLFTGMLMTENAFYPVFALTFLLIVLALERPTVRRQLLVLIACAFAYATRAQAIAFVPAVLAAPLVHGLIERDVRARLRRWVPLYATAGVAAVLALAATIARGRSPLALLGAYRAAADNGYTIGGVLRYLLWHAAELDLYIGVVGFAALLAMWFAPRGLSPGARAFVAASIPVVPLFLVEVAAFASTESFRIEERNDFYLAPLLLIPLVGLLGDGVVPRGRRPLAVGAAVAGVLAVGVPFGRFVNTSAVSDTFGLLPWWWVQDHGITFGTLRYVALAAGLAAGALLVFLPRRYATVLVSLVAVYFVLTSAAVENGRHGIHQASLGALWAGIRVEHPDWIDRRVGRGADVAFLWHYAGETRPLWNNEFFNRSIGDVYTVDGPDPADGGLPETPVREGGDGVLVDATGAAPRVRYAVSYTDIAGSALARDRDVGLTLYKVDGPLIILTHVTGLYREDTWAGRRVTYRRLDCAGGHLDVRLGTDEHLFTGAQTVTARSGGRIVARQRVRPAEQPVMRVPLRPDAFGRCLVAFTMRTLRVPARVQAGSTDTRQLGAHFYTFDYTR